MLKQLLEAWRIRSLPRVATIATMPTRIETFARVVARLLPQVDRMFVFLDGFEATPGFLLDDRKITVLRSQEVGELHSTGRFLALRVLEAPSVVLVVDDDIKYPRNYVARMVRRLAAASGKAVIGVHGGIFKPPYESYVTDGTQYHFSSELKEDTRADALGAGTAAFLSEVMDFDVRQWVGYDHSDLQLALEAKRRQVPLICIKRRKKWLRPLAEDRADSLLVEDAKGQQKSGR